jgi:Zn-dependent M32 family carboxypeptidase
MTHPLDPKIAQCLQESWAALDQLLDAYTEGLTTAQLWKVIRCRELLVELLVEREEK